MTYKISDYKDPVIYRVHKDAPFLLPIIPNPLTWSELQVLHYRREVTHEDR